MSTPPSVFPILACMPQLPGGAAMFLAGVGDRAIRKSLAANPAIGPEVAAKLCADPAPEVRRAALARITDPDLLTRAYTDDCAATHTGVAANPATPARVLAKFADSAAPALSREALANPATPAAAVARNASRIRDRDYLGRSSSDAHASITAARMLAAHPQLTALWADVPNPVVRRLIARTPNLDDATADRVQEAGRSVPRHLRMNPFRPSASGTSAARRRLDELVTAYGLANLAAWPADALREANALGSATLDLLLAEQRLVPAREDLTALLLRGRAAVEPDVLAALCRTGGVPVAWQVGQVCGITRCTATAIGVPEFAALLTGPLPRMLWESDAEKLAVQLARLGSDEDTWRVLMLLAADWDGTFTDLVTAATGISTPSRPAA